MPGFASHIEGLGKDVSTHPISGARFKPHLASGVLFMNEGYVSSVGPPTWHRALLFPVSMILMVDSLSSSKTIYIGFPVRVSHRSRPGKPAVLIAWSAATISASGVE